MKYSRLFVLAIIIAQFISHSAMTYADAPPPDIPEVNGYVPTQIADIEEPHPFANRVIVEEPVANTYGTAVVNYPIAIPAGRNGLQPNIDLTYSSSNGASVFGYGWTMQQPAITIDTRWGVPRYDRQYETEIYTLNGTQIVQKDGNPNLTLPYQTHIQQQRRNGNVSFMSRDTKNKDVITRHGNSPRNYWWSVVDGNGTTYYYGKYQKDATVNDACILTDETDNIGYWALAEVVDLHGNYMRYEYEKEEGTDLYMTNIYYTGHYNEHGTTDLLPAYKIKFHYYTYYGDGLQSDCRLGFIRRQNRLICCIDELYLRDQAEVLYKTFVRHSFFMNGSILSSNKTAFLISIIDYGIPESLHENEYLIELEAWCSLGWQDRHLDMRLNKTSFSYNDDYNDVFEIDEHIIKDNNSDYKNLNESRNMDWSLGGTLTVGVGPDAWITNISAGGNYDFSKSKGDVDMTLMDINGDGLADKVYIKNDSIYYRKQVFSDTISFFSTEQNTGIPAKSLNHDVSKTNQWGLQAGAAVPGEVAGANISGGWSVTNTQTSSYFADVNGDGLPDYIDDGTVYFNSLKSNDHFIKHNGEYVIQTDSSDCQSNFYYDGAVALGQDCYLNYKLVDTFSVNPHPQNESEVCELCEYITRQLLYYDEFSYWFDVINCSKYCDINLDCSEWEWNMNGDEFRERCETYPEICTRCLGQYLQYGAESQEYQSCRDFYCIFNGQRMICDTCRERCLEDSVDCECCIEENCAFTDIEDPYEGTIYYVYGVPVCVDCLPYCQDNLDSEECYWCRRDYCNLLQCEPEYTGYCRNGMEICAECYDRCNDWESPEECNRCKRENLCKGYIPEDLFVEYLSSFYDDYSRDGMLALIEQLQARGVICEGCQMTCRNDPAKCIPCLHKYCYYREEEDIVDELVYERKQEYLLSHPKAYFVQDYNKVYVYDTMTVCRKIDNIDPNIEAVRVWVAPMNGTIRINSNVQLLEDTSLLRRQSRSADGVRCVIQHDKQVQVVATSPKHLVPGATDIITAFNISATDYTVHSGEYTNISVNKGDVLSFRLRSRTSHSFDNVDWTQQIHYISPESSYHSSNDYICSSIETFEYDELGEATIEYWADVQSGGTAAVSIMRGSNSVNSYIVTSALNTHASVTIPNIHPDKDNALYLTLYSTHPEKVHVRAKVTFRYGDNLSKSVTKWLVPDVSFTRDNDEIHDDVYYDLFGPLYRGWGQYAFNNKYGTAIIPLDSLYNPYKKIYEENHNDTASYRASIQYMAEMDTLLLMESPSSMEETFSQLGLYNPLEPLWIEMRADAEYYQWEAYGKVARVGQNIMSNTRDEVQQAATATASPIADAEFDFYDSDVPLATNGARPMTVRKESKTKQWNLSFGANIGGLAGIGRTKSKGTYKLQTDYMDMNGDRYPDIVREQAIQYTKPWGGLGETCAVDAYLHETNTITEGCSFSGNFGKTVKLSGGVKNDRFMTSISGSSGFGVSSSNNEASFILQDVNTDGLPDKLVISGDSVYIYLNLGYNFSLYKTIPHIGNLSKTYSESASGNVGFSSASNWGEAVEQLLNNAEAVNDKVSMYQASISAGCNSSASTNTTYARLADINGNGRLDLISKTSNGFQITFNIFDRSNYDHAESVGSNAIIQQSKSSNAGFNLALTGGYTFFGILKLCAGVQTNPVCISETFGTHDMIDMNGDGLPDLVRVANNKIYVRYNTSGKTGLLKSIKTLNGKRIDLDYTLSQPTSGQPYRQMSLTSVRNIDENATADTGVPVMEKRIEYADPHYDPSERQSYGYGSVITYDMYPATNNDTARIYRKHVRRYQNQEYAEHGKLIYDAVLDSLDNLYTEYELGTVYYDASGHETDNTCQDTKIHVGKEAHLTRYYEGTAEPITTAKIYDYDNYHNVTRYEDLGDSLIANDDLLTTITYENRAQYVDQNLISLPKDVIVKAAGQNIRKTRSEYTIQGKLSKQVESSLINGNDSCVTDYSYNDFGLLSHVTLPCNQICQRGTIGIFYDSLTHCMPVCITNHFGLKQQYRYTPKWQQPLMSINPAGDTIAYEYDDYGRLTSVTALAERNEGMHTIEYAYGSVNYENCRLYVETKYYSKGDSTLQRSLYDSHGLLLQRQKRGGSNYIVTDRHSYDCFGRVVKTYSPTTVNDLSNYYISQNRQLVASYTYDILDRQTSVRWNDNNHNISTIQYLLGIDYWGAKRLKTVTTDENGHEWQSYTSPQGWLTTTIASDSATTRFDYDALGQLITSTDADGMTTTHTYNGLGRRIQRNHPDAGITQWQHDPAGNIITSATQQQTEDATRTEYGYDYDRLVSVHQPAHDELDITYTYDSVGRIASRTDITGVERFIYDQMGNIIQSDRLVALPSEQNTYRFITNYEYDSFGRLLRLTFPDGKWAGYEYSDGLLSRIYTLRQAVPHHGIEPKGLPRPRTINFLNDCEYNEYEMPVYYTQGQFTTEYTYDPSRLWLVNKVTYHTDDNIHTLQFLDYMYDGVGNIISIEQAADTVHWLGGAYIQQFQYDTQNRLKRADMVSDYWGVYSNYNLTYSPSGMIGTKNCDDMLWTYWHGYCGLNNNITNHQVRSIYDMENDATTFYTWDAAGRLQNIYEPCAGDISHYQWNEYGQMAAMVDNGNCAFYGYDGNGERTYKLTGNTALDQYNAGQQTFHAYLDNAVIYVNPYLTITPRNYMRHIFNGSRRIATEIGSDDLTDCIDTTAVGAERMANARAYMQSLLSESIELEPDTAATFVDIAGEAYDELQWQCTDDALAWNVTVLCDTDIILPILRRDSGTADTRITGTYYYHTDHLGSASWITHGDEPVQFIHYMPYGEMWYNQRGSAYNERYKYTGKERDEETGNDYFGARYYAAYTPMWLSPDPLMDKYPGISPYAYCNWNPMKYVDPDGKKITIAPNGLFERIAQRFGFSVGYVKKVQQDLEYLKTVNPTTRGMVEQLENSDNEHIIRFPQKKWNNSKPFCSEDFNNHKGQGSVVDYDPDNWKSKNGDKRNPRAGLGHELRHSLDIDKGTGTLESENGIPLMEVDAINTENQVRQQTGDAKRTTYGGKEIPSNLLD